MKAVKKNTSGTDAENRAKGSTQSLGNINEKQVKRLKIITKDKKGKKNRQEVCGVTNEIPLTEDLEQYSKNNKHETTQFS